MKREPTNKGNVRVERPVRLPTGGTKPLYTISRCRKSGDLYGKVHGSMDASITTCGINCEGEDWWIITNAFDGEITCGKCLREA